MKPRNFRRRAKKRIVAVLAPDRVLAFLALEYATINPDSYVGIGQNFNICRWSFDKKWVWTSSDPHLGLWRVESECGQYAGTPS